MLSPAGRNWRIYWRLAQRIRTSRLPNPPRGFQNGYVTVGCGNFVPEAWSAGRTLQEIATNTQTFNALMNQQVSRLTLRQLSVSSSKNLDELNEQQKGLAVIEASSAAKPRCC